MNHETYTFTDTEDTIADNPAGIARQEAAELAYDAEAKELAIDARAILHSLRRRLTGTEIAHCEAAAGLRDDMTAINVSLIDSIRIHFSREIAEARELLGT